jgi:photosystem II stability/assembly factor-like uncharacterized protein
MFNISISAMTTILAGMQNSLLVLRSTKAGWNIHQSLVGTHPQSVAFDPVNSDRSYCGTFGGGLWKTDDGGQNWNQIGKDSIASQNVTAVSVNALGRGDGDFNIVYAGTEPSELYRSMDGGSSWEGLVGLNTLSSSQSWSFPPRPWTHHVRWIQPDVNNSGYIFVAIEAGALVQSRDGGRTWIDRTQQGPYDTHTLATHLRAPKRLYSSAGDGYFESYDYGQTWSRPTGGLKHHYLYGLAVDSDEPNTVVVSASSGAWQAHNGEQHAESFLYRRSGNGGGRWELLSKGLPDPQGTMIAILAASSKNAGEFYVVSNRGIFCSTDSGVSWKVLDLLWPREYLSQHAWALAIADE